MNKSETDAGRLPLAVVVSAIGLAALTVWSFLPALTEMSNKWASNPLYSHGYLVPLFAFAILYVRRVRLAGVKLGFSWGGLPLIALAGLIFVTGGLVASDTITGLALIPATAGLFVIAGGWSALAWSWPAVGFLAFMIPLPYQIEIALSAPLRGIATTLSTLALQTFGFPAIAEGNVILLEHGSVAVVEACSGLGMLLTFLALATAVLIIANRPIIDKLLVLFTIPAIAVFANVVRITANGVAVELWGADVANRWFHDQAGWLMMPIAITMLCAELWVLAKLFPTALAGEKVLQGMFIPGMPLPKQPAVTLKGHKR